LSGKHVKGRGTAKKGQKEKKEGIKKSRSLNFLKRLRIRRRNVLRGKGTKSVGP